MRLVELVINEIEARRFDDVSTRWELMPQEGLTRFECYGPLMSLFVAWQRARGDDPIPSTHRFDTMSALRDKRAGVRIVHFLRDGVRMVTPGAIYIDWTAAIENDSERSWLESDLYTVKEYMRPAYHHIDQMVAGRARQRYSRLLLPVGDECGGVAEIVVAENFDLMPFVVPRVG
ncbi:MAG: hypothetical protein VW835_19860 [Rickettsiales bacterium]|jgi:hypothetical protein